MHFLLGGVPLFVKLHALSILIPFLSLLCRKGIPKIHICAIGYDRTIPRARANTMMLRCFFKKRYACNQLNSRGVGMSLSMHEPIKKCFRLHIYLAYLIHFSRLYTDLMASYKEHKLPHRAQVIVYIVL